jgi:hypothetical protein
MKGTLSELHRRANDVQRKGWTNNFIHFLIDTLWRDPSAGSNTSVQNFELELARKSTGGSYMEYTETAGLITRVDYWQDPSKLVKLFTKTITYSGSNPVQIITTDEVTGEILQTEPVYTGDVVTRVIKTIT